jgi:thiamine kinase-like enzyme
MGIVDTVGIAGLVGKVGAQVARERFGPAVRLPDAGTVPPSAESITPGWLTSVLCRDTPGARVLDVRVVGGHSGTSARRALRVTYNNAGQVAGLPTSLFTKSTATFTSRLLLGVTEIVEGETLFYTVARPGLELRSPTAYYAGFDPGTYRSMLLLADLGELGWTFPEPMTNKVTRADAEDIVTQMAAYHGAFWDSPRFGTDLRRLRPTVAWQQSLNRISYEKRTLKGLERARAVVPDEVYARRAELQPKLMRSLALHAAGPVTLLHQDMHLGNWLRDPDGRMGLYDWQCVGRGQWAQDFSYALAATLPTADRRNWERDLLRLYLDRLAAAGVAEPLGFDAAWLSYRQQPLHALTLAFFSIGGSRLENQLQPLGYMLWAIERIAQLTADLETFDALN